MAHQRWPRLTGTRPLGGVATAELLRQEVPDGQWEHGSNFLSTHTRLRRAEPHRPEVPATVPPLRVIQETRRRLEKRAEMQPDMHGEDQLWAMPRKRADSLCESDSVDKLWDCVRDLPVELRRHERIRQQKREVCEDWQEDLEVRIWQAVDERFETHVLETADQSTVICDRMEAHYSALEETVQQVKHDVLGFANLQATVEHLSSRLAAAEKQSDELEGTLRDSETRLHEALVAELRKRESEIGMLDDQLHSRIDGSETKLRHEVKLVEGSIADQLRKTTAEVQQHLSDASADASKRWDQLKERVVAIEKDLERAARKSSDALRLATEGASTGVRLEARSLEIGSRCDSLAGGVAEVQRRLSELDGALEASRKQHSKVSEGLSRVAAEQKSTTQVATDAAASFQKLESRLDEMVRSLGSSMQQCAQQSASELKEETTRRFAEIDEWKERLRNSIESMQLKARSLESTICRIDAADSQRATDAEAARSQTFARISDLDNRMERMAGGLETSLTQVVVKHWGELSDTATKQTAAAITGVREHVDTLHKCVLQKLQQAEETSERDIMRRVQRAEQTLDAQSLRLDELDKKSADTRATARQASERQANGEERLHALETGLSAVNRAKAESELRLEEVRSALQAATVQNNKTTIALKSLKDEHEATTQTASGALSAIRDIDTRTSKNLKALEASVQEQCDHLGSEVQTQTQRSSLAVQQRLEGITGDLQDKLVVIEKKVAREAEDARTAMEVGMSSKRVAEDALAAAQRVEQWQKTDTPVSESKPRPVQSHTCTIC